jgi:hypothetical protein
MKLQRSAPFFTIEEWYAPLELHALSVSILLQRGASAGGQDKQSRHSTQSPMMSYAARQVVERTYPRSEEWYTG